MKRYEVSVMKQGFIIEKNFVMAESDDDAYNKFLDSNNMEGEWEITNDDMSIQHVDIKEVK